MSLKRILGQEKAFECTTKKENEIEIAISVVSKSSYKELNTFIKSLENVKRYVSYSIFNLTTIKSIKIILLENVI